MMNRRCFLSKTHRADGFYQSKPWFKARAIVLKRDGYVCRFCGADVRAKGASRVDHIKKRTQYPELALELTNLQILCANCHQSVKARDENNPDRGCNCDGIPTDPNNPWNTM